MRRQILKVVNVSRLIAQNTWITSRITEVQTVKKGSFVKLMAATIYLPSFIMRQELTETLALHFHILVPFKKIFNSNQVSSYNIKFPSQITKKSVQPSLLCSKHTFFFLHQTYLIQIWWKRKTKTKFQRYTLQIPKWKSLPASIIREGWGTNCHTN